MFHMKLHKLLFLGFLFLIPIQTRILYNPDKAYINWYFDYHLGFFLYLSDILLFTCFTVWLLFDPPKLDDLTQTKLFPLILGFISLCLVTLFHVKRVDLGWYETVKWLEFFLLLLYIKVTYRDWRDYMLGLAAIFTSTVVQAIIGISQFHVQHMLGLSVLGEYISPLGTSGLATIETVGGKIIRAYGTMPHPNVLGAFLVLGLTIGLYFLSSAFAEASSDKHTKQYVSRVTIALANIILLLGIFTTFSRIAWITTVLVILAFVSYYLWSRKNKFVLTILLIGVIASGVVFGFYNEYLKARTNDNNVVSVGDRYFFNSLGWDLMSRFPILGTGVGNYVIALEDLYQLQPWQHQPAHNIFIYIAGELGILGAALFIIILFEIFQKIKNIKFDNLSFSLVLVGIVFLLMSQFDHYFVTIQQGRLIFATVLGLIAALPNLKQISN
jgi:O-antigen ligase